MWTRMMSPWGADVVAADHLFAAEEFFLLISAFSGSSSCVVVQSRPAGVDPFLLQRLLFFIVFHTVALSGAGPHHAEPLLWSSAIQARLVAQSMAHLVFSHLSFHLQQELQS